MQPPSPDNHLSGNGKTLNPSYGALSTQQFGFIEDDSVHTPNPMKQQMFLENARAVVDYTQANIWCPIPKNCEDSFSLPYLVSEAVLRSGMLGYGQHSPHNLGICTSDHPGLIPTLSSESENWCQSTGLSEDQQMETGYQPPSGIHNAYMMHGSSDMHSPFIGFLSQKVCLICGDEASGCHYGVITCGSCKVFYKRAVEGHHNYLCAGRNDCIVDKIRRKNCPACRLRKCYQAGMILGGRKLRKLNNLKAMGVIPALAVHSPQGQSYDCQALVSFPCMPMVRELQFTPQIISILENIEPETVYSGYDSTQPETPSLLLNSLNRLCERQLLWIVKWSKSLPGFRSLHINDQMTLIQYSWMNLMVFSLGWRSYQNVTREYLYFAPDLILSEERMRRSPISDLCLAMQVIPQEFANLQVTKKEFLCMKALILLNTVPLEGLKSQAQFDEMRYSYIRELTKATPLQEKGMVASSQRFYNLTKLMDAMHEDLREGAPECLRSDGFRASRVCGDFSGPGNGLPAMVEDDKLWASSESPSVLELESGVVLPGGLLGPLELESGVVLPGELPGPVGLAGPLEDACEGVQRGLSIGCSWACGKEPLLVELLGSEEWDERDSMLPMGVLARLLLNVSPRGQGKKVGGHQRRVTADEVHKTEARKLEPDHNDYLCKTER
ncbi:hypothetical protein JZ751_002131 [Albula glossodonta]|uniref:Progesterone receptor n=1 Tax=Albula glossodonta TaxID=121402 RepID=A0A8T2P9K7_9TELE|nr:hypothetical protein JZ751_002131 [Albula glossodonta]